MSDQAAGLRAWAEPGSLSLSVIGDPENDALMQALAMLPAPTGRRWQAARSGHHAASGAWLLWVDVTQGVDVTQRVDVAQIDVADLYRRLKLAFASSPAIENPELVLLWLHGVGDASSASAAGLNANTLRLLDNLSTTLKRFMQVELTRDAARWYRSLPVSCSGAVS